MELDYQYLKIRKPCNDSSNSTEKRPKLAGQVAFADIFVGQSRVIYVTKSTLLTPFYQQKP